MCYRYIIKELLTITRVIKITRVFCTCVNDGLTAVDCPEPDLQAQAASPAGTGSGSGSGSGTGTGTDPQPPSYTLAEDRTTQYLAAINLIRGDGSAKITYNYDRNGNIIQADEAGAPVRYSYDALNRLTREDNSLLAKTFLYEYNLAGNITKVTECAYTLSDAPTPVHVLTYAYNSRHQLTGVTGLPALNASSGIAANAQQQPASVTGLPAIGASSGIAAIPSAAGSPNADSSSVSGYDPAGNPTSYRGASLNWFRGRMLKSCTLPGGTNLTYAYDSNGIRVSKTINGASHTYYTEGSRIIAERFYTQNMYTTFAYLYDASGITGLRANNTLSYFFLKNQQGDIKFIVDANGNTLNEYVYDAWGNHKVYKYINSTILADSSGNPIDIRSHSDYTNDIGNLNPFRYRS